ncbi:MAG: hypothetical protein ACF8PN_06060 [Phycisphaerales bacterium]
MDTKINRSLACASLFAASFAGAVASAQLDLGVADNDVWAYVHSQNPGGDPVIRLWGAEGMDLNPTGYPGNRNASSFFSYGFMNWDLDEVPPGFRWNGATLTVTVAPDSNYDPAVDEVYIRLLEGPFDESSWSYGVGPGPVAGDNNRIAGDDSVYGGAGSLITFEIPRTVPRSVLQQWAQQGFISLAITTTADQVNEGKVLRIGTGENLLYEGPRLVLH